MNKKAQLQILTNPKTVSYMIGGAIIGYFLFQTMNATFLGGIAGLIVSFVR